MLWVGLEFTNDWRAVVGHREEFGMVGSLIILQDLADCRVLDHLIIMWVPGGANMTSPLAKCWRGLKVEEEVGKRLDIRKNPWKANKNNAAYADG